MCESSEECDLLAEEDHAVSPLYRHNKSLDTPVSVHASLSLLRSESVMRPSETNRVTTVLDAVPARFYSPLGRDQRAIDHAELERARLIESTVGPLSIAQCRLKSERLSFQLRLFDGHCRRSLVWQ